MVKNTQKVEGVLQVNTDNFVVVVVNGKPYTVSNWYGTRKKFNLRKKDLPINCKGFVNKFTGKLFNTRYKSKNFDITDILK